ncbi:MAG: tripartite tricarboxylate transporter substrate binding protein [Pararhodobacter sp.]|nr:tripartite tricarboxylate transporter substrate binding protein [Pararhodobacter sp.]
MKRLIALTLAATLGTGAALADEWPSRTVTITVGFGPGSTPDLMARLIAENLQERLGQPFVVDNRPGAGGNIALDGVAQAEPDGYTLGVTIPGPLIVNPMRMDLMYDPATDIRPVTILGTQPSVLAVSPELGVSTLEDLVALLAENPGEFNYSSIGVGSISHLAMEMIALESDSDIVHIPFTSSPEAVLAVVNGEVQMAAMPPLAVLPQVAEGNLIMLGQTAAERMPVVADVPTFAESGLPGVQAEAWMALAATGGTPDAVIERLYAEVAAILALPEVQERLAGWGMAPVGMPPAEFEARIAEETGRWRAVVEAAGLAR